MDTSKVLFWKSYLIPRKAIFHYSCKYVITVKQSDCFKEHFHINLHENWFTKPKQEKFPENIFLIIDDWFTAMQVK